MYNTRIKLVYVFKIMLKLKSAKICKIYIPITLFKSCPQQQQNTLAIRQLQELLIYMQQQNTLTTRKLYEVLIYMQIRALLFKNTSISIVTQCGKFRDAKWGIRNRKIHWVSKQENNNTTTQDTSKQGMLTETNRLKTIGIQKMCFDRTTICGSYGKKIQNFQLFIGIYLLVSQLYQKLLVLWKCIKGKLVLSFQFNYS
eukprot:TRINITY_DN9283_c3_g1_i1.p1 TRINITY_DN9283_c3_g1~~TRINITY_DN9283_c3_g1_i1.p1  ORF type:complete len:209 (+),score=-15.22 TRINITY_DN9283_c3_g1_i1:31-627(+)